MCFAVAKPRPELPPVMMKLRSGETSLDMN
jgi:hypothetical protein